jgi:general secretion pathway protein A
LNEIQTEFERGQRIVVLEGASGTGKSRIIPAFLERLDESTEKILVDCAPETRSADLLQAVLFDLNQPYHGMSTHELRLAVRSWLLTCLERSVTAVLIVDQAERLQPDAVQVLLDFVQLEQAGEPALAVLLLAESGFRERMEKAGLPRKWGAYGKGLSLPALTQDECTEWLEGQMPDRIWDTEARELVTRSCQGIIRDLQRVCRRAGELALQEELDEVNVEVVMMALEECDLILRPKLAEKWDIDDEHLPHPGQVPRPLVANPTTHPRRRSA